MSRASLKAGLGLVLNATAADRLIGALSGITRLPLTIGYHRVTEDARREFPQTMPAMSVSRQVFERQLDWIGRRYRFVSLDEIGERVASAGAWTEPVAAVTFDDGYSDVYHHAFPILMRKGIPAAVFVVTDSVGASAPFTHDRIYTLLARKWTLAHDLLVRAGAVPAGGASARSPFDAMRFLLTTRTQGELELLIAALEQEVGPVEGAPEALRPLTWDMVSTMQRAGISIGSHTRTHPVLTSEEGARVLDELKTSRDALGERLGTPISHFAYPDGAFDSEVVAAVAAAGYRFAYTTCHHRDPAFPLLTIPRRLLWEKSCLDAVGAFSPAVMSCVTSGVYDLVRPCRRPHRGVPRPLPRRGERVGPTE